MVRLLEITTVAQDINTSSSENIRYDMSCKRLLSQKRILAWILQGCVPEFKGCAITDIAELYIEGEPQVSSMAVMPDTTNASEKISGMATEDASVTEGVITYDIRFMATVPHTEEPISLIINIEAQNNFYPGYPLLKRGIYYCSRMISAQYGTVFSSSEYGKLKKVYSIWLCMDPAEKFKNSISLYHMQEELIYGTFQNNKKDYDLLSVIMVCLAEANTKPDKKILALLNSLFSEQLTAGEKKQILSDKFQIPMTYQLAKEVDIMCNLSAGIERRSMAKGIELGKIEERRSSKVDSIRKMMKNLHLTAPEAMKVLEIPEKEWEKYESML